MQVCHHPSANINNKMLIDHKPTSTDLNLCTIFQGIGTIPLPTPPRCDPEGGCIPIIPG